MRMIATCNGFTMKGNRDGTYLMKLVDRDRQVYSDLCDDYRQAIEWIFDMADDMSVAREVADYMGEMFGKNYMVSSMRECW